MNKKQNPKSPRSEIPDTPLHERVYYTPQELAALWKCHPETVLDLLRAGKLKGFKLGRSWRITERAVLEYEDAPENQLASPCSRFGKGSTAQPQKIMRVV